ncbi:MAG: 23S rRNA (adenine(2503)-C(2))-methyltransferase RlmN [bacterium]|nr:23S rRNA (adenine(2503)-C(2))-methyltransferase RlmN [bacterium]
MKSILELNYSELKESLLEKGYRKYRADQIYKHLYKRFILDFDDMTDISKIDREKLKEEFSFIIPEISERHEEEESKTIKFNLKLTDENIIETVVISAGNRVTQCVSSEVGCRLGCVFCATAGLGYNRSLTVEEYVSQVLLISNKTGSRPTNLVFMGMGEPLMNTDNLIKAIGILSDMQGFDFGLRKITVSTAGIIPEIERLLLNFPNIGIAISLNSTNEKQRTELMPINQKYPVKDIFNFLSTKRTLFKRRPTIEYILIDKINDSEKDADQLIKLTDRIPCKINLIPYNPHPGCDFKRSTRIDPFLNRMMNAKNAVTFRQSAGTGIYAACGQLANIKTSSETEIEDDE